MISFSFLSAVSLISLVEKSTSTYNAFEPIRVLVPPSPATSIVGPVITSSWRARVLPPVEEDDIYDDYEDQADGFPIHPQSLRIVFDETVYCHDPVDFPFSNMNDDYFPSGFHHSDYGNLHTLCSNTRWDQPPGMGCKCFRPPFSSVVRCEADRAHPALYNTPLQRLCQLSCYCRVWGVPRRPGELGKYLTNIMPGVNADTRSGGIVYYFESEKAQPLVVKKPNPFYKPKGGGNKVDGAVSKAAVARLRISTRPPEMCRLSCNGPRDCSTWAKNCICRASAQRFDAKSQASIFIGHCSRGLAALSDRLGKAKRRRRREQGYIDGGGGDRACVCNSTYVSAGCCFAGDNGLLWEPSEKKLGRLEESPDLK